LQLAFPIVRHSHSCEVRHWFLEQDCSLGGIQLISAHQPRQYEVQAGEVGFYDQSPLLSTI
jgi:hypothetical protein